MRIFLIIVGLMFIIGGLGIMTGTMISIIEGSSTYSLASDMLGMFLIGVIPAAIGAYMLHIGLKTPKK